MRAAKITAAQLDDAAFLREKGWSICRLARKYGVSEGYISWQMLRLGADPVALASKPLSQIAPGPAEVRRGSHVVRRFSPPEDEQLLQLAAQGLSNHTIGKKMTPPRTHNSVRGRLMTLARHEARREAHDEGRRA